MFSKTIIAFAAAAFATQAMGAAVTTPNEVRAVMGSPDVARAIMIAPDPISACNCPNNCKHKNGDSCKYYDNGNTLSGECQIEGDHLKCIA